MARGDESSNGSFRQDLDWLLEQLSEPAIIELGKPEPKEKYLPLKRAAKCPAMHNRILFDAAADRVSDAS